MFLSRPYGNLKLPMGRTCAIERKCDGDAKEAVKERPIILIWFPGGKGFYAEASTLAYA